MAKRKGTSGAAANNAAAPNAPTPSAESSIDPAKGADLAFEDAAKIADLDVDEIFAAKEYEDRYQVVTTDGRKVVVEK